MRYVTQYEGGYNTSGEGYCWEVEATTVGEPNWLERLFKVRPTRTRVSYFCFCDTKYPPPWDWRQSGMNDVNSVRFDVGKELTRWADKYLSKERLKK